MMLLPDFPMPADPENYTGYWIGKGLLYGMLLGCAIGAVHKIIMILIGGNV